MVLHPNLVQLVVAAVAQGGGPWVVVITAAFHARVRGSFLGVLKETKMFAPHPPVINSVL